MSGIGIDFGALSTKIAVARRGGVDIITNEVSNRSTPSLVGFGPKSRYIGEPAKTQEISNLKNTVSSLKLLIGRSFNDPDVQIEQEYCTAKLVDINGEVGAEVNFQGKMERFTATQLVAMYLNKIKAIGAAELKRTVADATISVPPWFTDAQRRRMLDAAEIAGLHTLHLMNDSAAIALGYGITKLDLPTKDEKPRVVAFIDIGHCNYTCSIVEFSKGKMKVKGTAWDHHFGGRAFDKALADHFAKEFKEKYKIDIKTNPKAWVRTLAAAEKLKKILSANSTAPLNIESLMNDVDVRSVVKREELEEMLRPLLDRVNAPIEKALAQSGWKVEDVDSIEMVGGCTRVPAIKESISKYFGKPLSFTLNQDEAVARGLAFSCALLSPTQRAREFQVFDMNNFPVHYCWEEAETSGMGIFDIWHSGDPMPHTKIITTMQDKAFDIEARYAKPELLPGKPSPWIGKITIKGPAFDKGGIKKCKFKATVDIHGLFHVTEAYYVEQIEVEEEIPEENKEDTTDAPNGDTEAEAKPRTHKVKKQVRKGDFTVTSTSASLEASVKTKLIEQENALFMEDKLVADTEDKKNELESFIYEMRDKIDSIYAPFSSEEEKSKIRDKLTLTEDWLYEDGEDTTKGVYIAKMDEIRFLAGPVVGRYLESLEVERQAQLKLQEEAAAKKKAEQAAAKAKADAEKNDAPNPGDEMEVEEAD
ncbi:adenyl-nucleotide exchange factor sse1 [Myotisia sp. PD_48]|nr:adenyl-nucleotide exchange factor sse1 [Myotisia sp. PD_48]